MPFHPHPFKLLLRIPHDFHLVLVIGAMHLYKNLIPKN